jgi:DNA-binding PadR family transcriptional regulator
MGSDKMSKNRFIELLNKEVYSITDEEKKELQEFLKEMKKKNFKDK